MISGASFGGLALACGLSRALGLDFKIALIDRVAQSAAAPKADSRASALSAASKRMLEVLDVWPLVADVAQPVTGIEITDSTLETGVRPVLLTYDNVTADGEPATYIVPNSALQAALRRGVESSSSLELITPAEAIDFASNESGIEVTLADGGAIAASLLVAAEGRRSRLREAAGIKVVGWSYPQIGIVVTVHHDRPHGGRAVQHFLPSGPFAILPLTGNRSCITWTEDAVEAKRILALDDADFLAEVDKRFGGKLGALSLDGPRQSWPLEMHLARRYVGPRFALIGDAAHGVHPIAGQGLNLAFRDVAALVDVLSDAIRLGFDAGDAQALARYERWRRFDSTISAATFDGLNRLFSSDRALIRSGRDFGLGLVDRMPMLKRFFVGEAAGLTGELPRLLKGEPV
ncbi:MAG: FAD-dependent monooxygenase [Hyphomicrobiaceae bacterium]|nr:FAD-dependent monooxygenase [Hyphomicrobiaceae bacterium]